RCDMQRRFVCVHHHQEIDIAIFGWLSIGIGTEENHFLWVALVDNLPGNTADPFKGCRGDTYARFVFAAITFCSHTVVSRFAYVTSALPCVGQQDAALLPLTLPLLQRGASGSRWREGCQDIDLCE